MITTSLIHMAIWTQFAVSHAAGMHFEFHALRQAPAAIQEKVVLRENTMSEKCDLGLEPVVRPDQEIVALRADASRFTSSIDLRANAKGPSWETPTMRGSRWEAKRPDWNELFAFSWDDDGGYWLGGKHFPPNTPDPNVFSIIVGFADSPH
jgi:hypothetical protein